MDEQIVVYLHNVILLSRKKKEQTTDAWYNMDESQYNCVNWNKPDKTEYTVYDSNSIKL